MRAFSFNPAAVREVALAIASVIAKRIVAEDRKLSKLDGLAKIMAANTLAENMVMDLTDEATAALEAAQRLLEKEPQP